MITMTCLILWIPAGWAVALLGAALRLTARAAANAELAQTASNRRDLMPSLRRSGERPDFPPFGDAGREKHSEPSRLALEIAVI
jgi:hypothetical protein